MRFRRVRLQAPGDRLPELADFYLGLGFRCLGGADGLVEVDLDGTRLELEAADGEPFYHFAFLVPGDRFDAALGWARGRVLVLPDQETGSDVFDFANWDAEALYFHDPAGNIVELIAHHGVEETGADGPFAATELIGLSELGLVCDPPSLAAALASEGGLALWDGSLDGEGRLAFVGEKARTLILCRSGRPWLPTGRPAEAHPVEVVLAGDRERKVMATAGIAIHLVEERRD